MKHFSFSVFVVFFTILQSIEGVPRFFRADCPKMESMPGFNIQRFLGEWFVVEYTSDNAAACLREEFSVQNSIALKPSSAFNDSMRMARLNEIDTIEVLPDQVNVKPSSPSSNPEYQMKRTYLAYGGRKFISDSGKIQFLSNETQSEMEIDFPNAQTGMVNLRNYQVIATDYEKYALVWRCQKTPFGHRRSAELLSRTASFEPNVMEEMKSLLRHFESEHQIKFLTVRQSDCVEQPSTDLDSKNTDEVAPHQSIDETKPSTSNGKLNNKKKLINIDIGGFHLSISLPFFN